MPWWIQAICPKRIGTFSGSLQRPGETMFIFLLADVYALRTVWTKQPLFTSHQKPIIGFVWIGQKGPWTNRNVKLLYCFILTIMIIMTCPFFWFTCFYFNVALHSIEMHFKKSTCGEGMFIEIHTWMFKRLVVNETRNNTIYGGSLLVGIRTWSVGIWCIDVLTACQRNKYQTNKTICIISGAHRPRFSKHIIMILYTCQKWRMKILSTLISVQSKIINIMWIDSLGKLSIG